MPTSRSSILNLSDIILNGHVHGKIEKADILNKKTHVLKSGATYLPKSYRLACQIIKIDINRYEYSTKIIKLISGSRKWDVKYGDEITSFRELNFKKIILIKSI